MGPIVNKAEAAARIRAVIAYTKIDHRDLAAQTGINIERIRRIASPTNPRGASIDELWAIADATGWPRNFMLYGLDRLEPDVPNTVAAGESALNRLVALIEQLTKVQQEQSDGITRLADAIRELDERIYSLEVKASYDRVPQRVPSPPHPPAATPQRRASRRKSAQRPSQSPAEEDARSADG